MLKKIQAIMKNSLEIKAVSEKGENSVLEDYVSLERFFQFGETKFIQTERVEGELSKYETTLNWLLLSIMTYECSRDILRHHEEKTADSFNQLLNAIFLNVTHFSIYYKEFFEIGFSYFESDSALLYIYLHTFYPQYLDEMESKINIANDMIYKDIIDNQRQGMAKLCGKDSVVYLAYLISKKSNNLELEQSFFNLCYKKPNDHYLKIDVENYFDEHSFENIINGLIQYHLDNINLNSYSKTFYRRHWAYLPVEVIFLVKVGVSRGYSIDFLKNNELVKDFYPFYLNELVLNERNIKLLAQAKVTHIS